jgi:DNA-binding Lrp family transcriptional regulator
METLEAPSTDEKLNADVAAMVKEISIIGPRIPEIARRLGRHKETVRYWYKKLEAHGFAVQASVNHEALGLKRLIFKVQFGEGYGDFVQQLMLAMNELAYIVSYAKALAEDTYMVNASVPAEFVSEYLSFMDALRDQGIFKSVESYEFDWVRNIPMDGSFYDFESGNWEFDMGSVTARNATFVEPTASAKIKFDRIDLLVAKELQADAARETQEIQRAIKERDNVDINYKTLCWHLDEHVKVNGILKGYKINWMGTRWDPVIEKVRHRSHSYMIFDVLVKRPTPEEKLLLMRAFNRLPLMWGEAAGDDYFAELAIPSEMILEGLQYLQRVTDSVSGRASYFMIDQRNAAGFTFSYNLFNEEERAWTFNKADLLNKFKALEVQVKGQ